MPRQDTVDFLTAFAVGTVLGIGATILLQPQPTPKQRVVKKLKPYRKQIQKSYKHVARGVRDGSDATSELTGELIAAGRELLGEFQAEMAEIVDQARADLQGVVKEQSRAAGKAAGKVASRGAKQARRRLGI
jgi:gas vesicle protein